MQPLTCEQAKQNGNQLKVNYINEIKNIVNKFEIVKLLIKDKETLSKEQTLKDFKASLGLFNINGSANTTSQVVQQLLDQVILQTNCTPCTARTVYLYSKCIDTETNKLQTSLKRFYSEIENINEFANNLTKHTETIISEVLSIQKIKEYYNKRLESFHEMYVKTKSISRNYIITNDVYSTGKTLVDSFKIALPKLSSYQCGIESELNRLTNKIDKIITPSTATNYPLPNLDEFASTYGGLMKQNGRLELVEGYERVFGNAEEVLRQYNVTGSTRAYVSFKDILASVDNLLGNASTCLGSGISEEEGRGYDLLSCVSVAGCSSLDIFTLKSKVIECYNEYKLEKYCTNYISQIGESNRYTELVICISMALQSPNNRLDCCFK